MGVDLFRRIYIRGTQEGQQLTSGAFLGSQDDYLIQALEQNQANAARTLSQNEPPIMVVVDPIDSGSFWAIGTNIDIPIMSEVIADVTELVGVEGSAEFWAWSRAYAKSGITVLGD